MCQNETRDKLRVKSVSKMRRKTSYELTTIRHDI